MSVARKAATPFRRLLRGQHRGLPSRPLPQHFRAVAPVRVRPSPCRPGERRSPFWGHPTEVGVHLLSSQASNVCVSHRVVKSPSQRTGTPVGQYTSSQITIVNAVSVCSLLPPSPPELSPGSHPLIAARTIEPDLLPFNTLIELAGKGSPCALFT